MPSRLKKTRKLRGSRTFGYGQVGQHRKGGMKGGKGKAGLHKHKWSWTVKYALEHFGRGHLKPKIENISRRWLNVGALDRLYDGISKGKKVKHKEGKPLIDLISLGYDKLLGNGVVSKPYYVIAPAYSQGAKDKVEKAGGVLVKGKEG